MPKSYLPFTCLSGVLMAMELQILAHAHSLRFCFCFWETGVALQACKEGKTPSYLLVKKLSHSCLTRWSWQKVLQATTNTWRSRQQRIWDSKAVNLNNKGSLNSIGRRCSYPHQVMRSTNYCHRSILSGFSFNWFTHMQSLTVAKHWWRPRLWGLGQMREKELGQEVCDSMRWMLFCICESPGF